MGSVKILIIEPKGMLKNCTFRVFAQAETINLIGEFDAIDLRFDMTGPKWPSRSWMEAHARGRPNRRRRRVEKSTETTE